MLNVLIADDNINYSKILINYLMKNNKDLRLVQLSTNGQEVLDAITMNYIDIVILDLKMPFLSGLKILDILEQKKIMHKPKIIVVSGYDEYIKHIISNKLVYGFVNKSSGLEKINEKVAEIIQIYKNDEKKQEVKKSIIDELLSLGYCIKHKGTKYLMEVILLIYEQYNMNKCEEIYVDNLERYFYREVARKHEKTTQNIKSNINKATAAMYLECDQNKLLRYFSFTYDYKPTPKVVINTILSKLH